jgi:hypothetical protein
MNRRPLSLLLPLVSALCLTGAGCLPAVTSPRIAQPLNQYENNAPVAAKNGFGDLPAISVPKSRMTVKLAQPLPELPTNISVLRLRRGDPTDTQLLNLASAIGLPGGVLGNRQTKRELVLDWTDDKQFHWTYRAAEHSLEFSDERAPAGPLTVSTLPTDDLILRAANDFLQTHGIDTASYRDPLVEPSWNLWWYRARDAGRCMDTQTLAAVRAIGASAGLIAAGPPPLPESSKAVCVSPEFPARLTVHYRMLIDNRDVVTANGAYVNGIELVVDVSRSTVVSGRITLAANPDRSDYPALPAARVSDLLLQGGLSGGTGDVVVSSYQIAALQVEDAASAIPATYLIPSLLASGTRTRADGTQEPFQIVVPLLMR